MNHGSNIPSMGAREARMKFREALDHTLRGTQVEITRHGQVEAYLVPAGWYDRAVLALFNAEVNNPDDGEQ